MMLDKQELERLLELSKTNQFLQFDVGEHRLVLMTEETFEEMQPRAIDRYIH